VANSVRVQIFDAILDEVRAVKESAGYERTVRTAERLIYLVPTIRQYDAVFLYDLGDSYTTRVSDVVESLLRIELTLWARDSRHPDWAVEALLADVHKAICADPTHGGLALDTEVESAETMVSEEFSPEAAARLIVRVKYRHAYGDPYTKR